MSEGFDEGIADYLEVGGDGFLAEGVEDPAFSSDGGALDLLVGVAGDEEECSAGRGSGWDGLGGGVDGVGGSSVPMFGFSVDERAGDDGFAGFELGLGEDGGVGWDGDLEDAEVVGGFVEGGGGAAVGPSAAEGDVSTEAEFTGFGLGVVDAVEEFW